MRSETATPVYATGVVIAPTPGSDLLTYLLQQRGSGWHPLATVTGLRIPNLRRWRGGQAPGEDAVARLVAYAEFLDTLDTEVGFTEPTDATAFMETPLPLKPGYLIYPATLYNEGHRDTLLSLAMCGDEMDAEAVLDLSVPGWREQRSAFEVFVDIDGERSIRLRPVTDR